MTNNDETTLLDQSEMLYQNNSMPTTGNLRSQARESVNTQQSGYNQPQNNGGYNSQPQQPQRGYNPPQYNGGYNSQPQGGYNQPQNNRGYNPPQNNAGYNSQPQGGYNPQHNNAGYNPQSQGGYVPPQSGGNYYAQQPQGGYPTSGVYGGAQNAAYAQRPARILATDRGLFKLLILSAITFGIYGLFFYSGISSDINVTASRYDGKNTMNFILALILGSLTLGIFTLIWWHNLSARMGAELQRRRISYQFDASTYWLWAVLGSLIFIGPLVFIHKVAKASNLINENYNVYG